MSESSLQSDESNPVVLHTFDDNGLCLVIEAQSLVEARDLRAEGVRVWSCDQNTLYVQVIGRQGRKFARRSIVADAIFKRLSECQSIGLVVKLQGIQGVLCSRPVHVFEREIKLLLNLTHSIKPTCEGLPLFDWGVPYLSHV